MIKVYNKLVRDKIPDFIMENNQIADYTVLSDEDYLNELHNKLNEEIEEYQKSREIEEMADIFEVLQAVCAVCDFSMEKIFEIKNKKAAERGGFEKKIYLRTVENKKKDRTID
ncbi:nucleoside triphosphate pyrophosphohydrolase [Anaerocolumna sp. MB42-C2]|uniref:nucleoside triphosphate pyrophosphohydrolase n=1 Tax=Anaerocolumna sp. MB42-C2 TaxID=3070997 RepID=UPI0027DF0828|nr:nucleoside triphosphate pyrophosphohydrolase [Anaerocolumna sp. MB42-C2]WMJ87675.1 nucleoside triphosphate pyrophosphohydrolase [Anaerocolumna sp. MB42-C2]